MVTVLIVDSCYPVREALTTVLEMERYRVLTAGSGAEALVVVGTERPDVVLLDLSIHDMSAVELRDRLRASGLTAPVVFMSLCPGVQREAEIHHAEASLEKPFDAPTLLATIARLLPPRRKVA